MVTVFFLLFFQDGATHANFGRIQLGMTRQDVAKIVRIPPVAKVTDDDRFSIWFTSASADIRQKGELWRSGTLKLWVVFGNDQRVSGKMLEYDVFAVTKESSDAKKMP